MQPDICSLNVYQQFTEGFATADLEMAAQPLEQDFGLACRAAAAAGRAPDVDEIIGARKLQPGGNLQGRMSRN
jgi:hypothetical protein